MIKKILLWGSLSLLLLLIAGIIAVGMSLGKIIKVGIETAGPKITQTSFKVDSVNLSVLSGSAGINGFVLGNPDGFKSVSAVSLGKAAVSIVPGSILSDKIIIHSVEVRDAEITFEGNPFGANNLKQIMDNVNALAGGGSASTTAPAASTPATASGNKPAKKLEVDDFLISGAKVHASITGIPGVGVKEITVPIPDIHFSDLGKGNDGITAGELTQKILGEITADTIKSLASSVADLGKNLTGAATGILSGAVGSGTNGVGAGVDTLKKGLGGLFGK
jgi:hypothetical protein